MAFDNFRYLKDLRGAKMDDKTFRVLVMLYTYSDKYGRKAHPGRERLAADCHISPSTVKRKLKLLVEQGYIAKVKAGGRSGDGAHWAAEYALVSAGQFDTSTGQNYDLNGSDPWGQEVTLDDPPSDHYIRSLSDHVHADDEPPF
jgi:DNA-binding transcriptional MocR family regulator